MPRVEAVRFRAGDEDVALFRHLLDVLLAHRPAQQIGAAERVAADRLRDLHHLLLVHHHAVGRREDRLEPRVRVVDPLAPALSRDVIGNERHRTRPVERDQRDDVLEPGRRRLLQQIAHAARFKLEHGGRIAGAEDVVGRLVVERQRVQRQRKRWIEPANVAHRPVEDRQRREPEEVELDESDRLDIVLVELRDEAVRAGLRVERAEVSQAARRNQHAARMHPDVAREAFERFGELEQPAYFLFAFLALGEQRLHFARRLERYELARLERNQLRDAVAEHVREVEHAPDVAYDGFRRHRAEGRDLRDRIGAVLLLHVIDDAVAAVLAEVDVEVRHRDALGIEKALEQQCVAQRIEVGDAERIGDERSRAGPAAGPHGNAVALRPVDEVGDDQEVAGVAHLHDGPGLEVEPRPRIPRACPHARRDRDRATRAGARAPPQPRRTGGRPA